jgi:hypothetical protein
MADLQVLSDMDISGVDLSKPKPAERKERPPKPPRKRKADKAAGHLMRSLDLELAPTVGEPPPGARRRPARAAGPPMRLVPEADGTRAVEAAVASSYAMKPHKPARWHPTGDAPLAATGMAHTPASGPSTGAPKLPPSTSAETVSGCKKPAAGSYFSRDHSMSSYECRR